MYLVIIKSDREEVVKRVGRSVEGIELMPGLYLTWTPREKVLKVLDRAKRQAVREWEERGEGPVLETAVLELTEDQYKEIRPMARSELERAASALLEEMGRLLEKMRSGKGGKNLLGWYRDLARRYEKLVNASLALDIEPTVMGRLRDRWKELSLEAGKMKS